MLFQRARKYSRGFCTGLLFFDFDNKLVGMLILNGFALLDAVYKLLDQILFGIFLIVSSGFLKLDVSMAVSLIVLNADVFSDIV